MPGDPGDVPARCARVLTQGPPPLTGAQCDRFRCGLTDLLDDYTHAIASGERSAIASVLWLEAARSALAFAGRRISGGKWLLRELRGFDSAFAAGWLAARDDPAPLATQVLARRVYPKFGLHLYFRDEGLAGVVVDAVRGPQVSVAGRALVGQLPSVLEQWMVDRAVTRPSETELVYLSAGVPASASLGVAINVQREGDRLLTRPVCYPAEALDDVAHWLPRDAWAIHD